MNNTEYISPKSALTFLVLLLFTFMIGIVLGGCMADYRYNMSWDERIGNGHHY
jgi:hypothetical protein